MEKHWLRKSPSRNGMPCHEPNDRNYLCGPSSATYAVPSHDRNYYRQYLNCSSVSETTYATSYQVPSCDPRSDRQHLYGSSNRTYGNTAPDTYYDHRYQSSAATSTSQCGGSMLAAGVREDSLISMTSGYRLEPDCYGQSSQYARSSPKAGRQKPAPEAYYCDGPGRNAYRRNEPISGTAETQCWAPSDASSRLDGAIDRTLEDWCHLIKNIGSDGPIDKLAQMLLDTPDASMMVSRRNESQMNSTFEPVGYSVIDRDEQSYRARNLLSNDMTIEGIEPSNVSWRISPEDSISLFKSRAANETKNRRAYGLSAECEEYEDQSVLYRTTDLMDRIKGFPSDVSGCDMADMLLPPPNGKPTKERLENDSSDFSVPNISDINNLLKAGLSSEELINELLDCRKAYPRSPSRNSLSVSCIPEQEGRSDRPTSPQRASRCQKEDIFVHESGEKKANITDSSNESFVPMSYSIIDQDQESILKKYQMANDVTLQGIENSNISWQLNPGEISLFKEHEKSRSFLRPVAESTLLEGQTRLQRSPSGRPRRHM